MAAAPRAPLLLLHGADDPAKEAGDCAALAGGLGRPGAGVAHRVLRGATCAWDHRTAPGPGGGRSWLPDPAGAPQRVLVEPDPVLAQIGLDRVLGFLLPRLQPGGGALISVALIADRSGPQGTHLAGGAPAA